MKIIAFIVRQLKLSCPKNRNRKWKNEEISRQKVYTNIQKVFLNQKWVNVCDHRVKPSISLRWFPFKFPSVLSISHPLWCRSSKSSMGHCLYPVFTYIYSLLIEKDIYDHQNISFKLPCVCVCPFRPEISPFFW